MIAWTWRATLPLMLKPILVSKSKHAVSEYICRVMSKMSPTPSSSVYKVRVVEFSEELATDIYTMEILESIKEGRCAYLQTKEGGPCHPGGRPVTRLFTHHKWRFVSRKLRCGSSGSKARVPRLSTLQGDYRLGQRKNLPHHGDVQRHSQRWGKADVSWFQLKNLFVMSWFRVTFSVSAECWMGNWPPEDLNRFILCLSRYQYVLGERTWIEYWPTAAECQTGKHRDTCLGMEEMVEQYTIFGCQNKWIYLVWTSLITVQSKFYHYARVASYTASITVQE